MTIECKVLNFQGVVPTEASALPDVADQTRVAEPTGQDGPYRRILVSKQPLHKRVAVALRRIADELDQIVTNGI